MYRYVQFNLCAICWFSFLSFLRWPLAQLAHENLIISKQFYEQSACYQKEKKIKVVERQIRDIEQFVIEDYGLKQLFIYNE